VTGLEEGMFPYKGLEPGAPTEELDEERRLAYVAITRARKQLVVSFAAFRQIFGTTRVHGASRFLREIPEDVLSRPVGSRPGEIRASAPPPPPSSFVSSGGTRPAGEISVEYDEPMQPGATEATGSFRRGMRVRHPKFGVGTVKGVEPGADLKLTVYFPTIGQEKKILAEFVQPVG